MDNFDKNLQDKLNKINEQDFEFKPAAWERFQQQRNKDDDDKGIFHRWLKRNSAAAAIILLLLISNIFFAHQSVSTKYQIVEMSNQFEKITTDFEKFQLKNQEEQTNYLATIENLSTNLNTSNEAISTLKTDNQLITSLLKKEIKKSVIKQSEQNDRSNYFNNNIESFTTPSFNNFVIKNIDNQLLSQKLGINDFINTTLNTNTITDKIIRNEYINSTEKEEGFIQSNPIVETEKEDIIESKFDFLETPILSLTSQNDSFNLNLKDIPTIQDLEGNVSFRNKLLAFGEKSSPTNHQIGLNFNIGFIPVENNVNSVIDIQSGVNASSLFFERLRLNAGINYWSQTYKYEELTDLSDEILSNIMTNLPTSVPFNGQDELNSIEGQIMGISFPITAQILLGNKISKWKPYVGFGIIGRYFNNAEFEYYYTDYNNSNTYEVKYPEEIKQFDFNLWTSSFGINYQISEQLELDTSFNFSKSNTTQPIGITNLEQFGGALNLKYNF